MFLSKALKNHQETIDKNKDVLYSNADEKIKLSERSDVKIVGTLYVILMVGLTWFGFSRWITQTHNVDEELRNLEKEIKRNTLQKLELEISQMKSVNKLTSHPWRRTH